MSVRLFVGNLAFDATDTDLRELFSAAGDVSQVRIPTDRETGKPRGFAFVDFAERAHADEAVRRFNQHVFKDRALAVNEARAPGSRPAGGPGPRPQPRPGPTRSTWSAPLGSDPDEDHGKPGQQRRNYGPDASARDKRKQKGRASKEERGPKGPLPERSRGGPVYLGALDDDEDDQGMDDFALWALEDAKNKEKE